MNDTSPVKSRGIGRKGDGRMLFVPTRDGFIPAVEKPPTNYLPLDLSFPARSGRASLISLKKRFSAGTANEKDVHLPGNSVSNGTV